MLTITPAQPTTIKKIHATSHQKKQRQIKKVIKVFFLHLETDTVDEDALYRFFISLNPFYSVILYSRVFVIVDSLALSSIAPCL